MQYKKNRPNFITLAAAIGLGIGLMLSGCGSSGSTTPNPLDGTTPTPPAPEPAPSPEPPSPPSPYKVTFQYNFLSKGLGRQDLSNDIVEVRYAFYGKADNKEFVTQATAPGAHLFKHEAKTREQDIVIDSNEVKELNTDIYAVSAAYYDKDGKLVSVGHNDKIAWDNKDAAIASPDLYRIDNNSELSLTSYDPTDNKDKRVFEPGDNVGLSFKLLPGDKASIEFYDLTPFATFSELNDIADKKVTVFTEATSKGLFSVVANGTVKPRATIDSVICDTVTKPIYATKQTINGIKFTPINSELFNGGDDKSFLMLYISKKDGEGNDIPNAALGKETVTVDNLVVGVDKVPVQVIAAYTDDKIDEKGPQPQDIDITEQVQFDVSFDEGFTPAGGHESYLKVENGVVIATGAVTDYADHYNVTASYGSFTDKTNVSVCYAESDICFAKDMDGNLSYVPESNRHESLYWNMRVVGRFKVITNYGQTINYSKPFFIDESLVGANEYPEAIASPSVVMYTEIFKRADNGSNYYLLHLYDSPKTHELKVGDFQVEGLPKFTPLQITPAR